MKSTDEQPLPNPLARHGGLSYLEIPAINPRRSAAFYQNVCGWDVSGDGAAEPLKFSDPAGLLIGRWIVRQGDSSGMGWTPYIYVNDLDAAVERAVASGGQITKTAYSEGNLRIATVRDPGGNVIGLWQFATPASPPE